MLFYLQVLLPLSPASTSASGKWPSPKSPLTFIEAVQSLSYLTFDASTQLTSPIFLEIYFLCCFIHSFRIFLSTDYAGKTVVKKNLERTLHVWQCQGRSSDSGRGLHLFRQGLFRGSVFKAET